MPGGQYNNFEQARALGLGARWPKSSLLSEVNDFLVTLSKSPRPKVVGDLAIFLAKGVEPRLVNLELGTAFLSLSSTCSQAVLVNLKGAGSCAKSRSRRS